MHELSIIQNVFEVIRAQLSEDYNLNETVVERIVLNIGRLSSVVPEALDFAFETARPETIFRESTLVINEIPLIIECIDCNIESILDEPVFFCKSCKSQNVRIKSGRELFIDSVDIKTDKE